MDLVVVLSKSMGQLLWPDCMKKDPLWGGAYLLFIIIALTPPKISRYMIFTIGGLLVSNRSETVLADSTIPSRPTQKSNNHART